MKLREFTDSLKPKYIPIVFFVLEKDGKTIYVEGLSKVTNCFSDFKLLASKDYLRVYDSIIKKQNKKNWDKARQILFLLEASHYQIKNLGVNLNCHFVKKYMNGQVKRKRGRFIFKMVGHMNEELFIFYYKVKNLIGKGKNVKEHDLEGNIKTFKNVCNELFDYVLKGLKKSGSL